MARHGTRPEAGLSDDTENNKDVKKHSTDSINNPNIELKFVHIHSKIHSLVVHKKSRGELCT